MKFRYVVPACLMFVLGISSVVAQGFSDKDKAYLKRSGESDVAQVKAAELAIRTTKNPKVKAFAERMRTDYTNLYVGSKSVAALAGVPQPETASTQGNIAYVELSVLRGKTFDKKYARIIFGAHAGDLKAAHDENASTANQHLKLLTQHQIEVMDGQTRAILDLSAALGLK